MSAQPTAPNAAPDVVNIEINGVGDISQLPLVGKKGAR